MPRPLRAVLVIALVVALTGRDMMVQSAFVRLPFEGAFRLGEWADPGTVTYAQRLDAVKYSVAAAETIRNRIQSEAKRAPPSAAESFQKALEAAEKELVSRREELIRVSLEQIDLESWAASPLVPSPVEWQSVSVVASSMLTPTSTLSSHVVFAGQENRTEQIRLTVTRLPLLSEVNAVSALAGTVASLARREFDHADLRATVIMAAVRQGSHAAVLHGLTHTPAQLRKAWNAYYPEESIADPSSDVRAFVRQWQQYRKHRCVRQQHFRDHAQDSRENKLHPERKKRISLVVGVRSVSVLVGLLHIHRPNPGFTDHSAEDTEAQVDFAQRLDALTGSTRLTEATARAALMSFTNSLNNSKFSMHVDFTSIGQTTTLFNRQASESKLSFQRYDPGKLSVNSVGGNSGTSAFRDQNERQDNMNSVIGATITAFHDNEATNLVSVESFLNVFDNFASDDSTSYGIATDAELLHFTRNDVLRRLADEYLGPSAYRISASDDGDDDDDDFYE